MKYTDGKGRIYEVSQGIGDGVFMIFYREPLKSGKLSGLKRCRVACLHDQVSHDRAPVQSYLNGYAGLQGWKAAMS
jgi:hypothetical protein